MTLSPTKSRFFAKKVLQDIREKVDPLRQLPRAGKKLPGLDDDAIRELSLNSYRIICDIREQGIFVLTVVHKRRHV